MDEDRVELLRRLFVSMTEVTEDIIEVTMKGQGNHGSLESYLQCATQIEAKAEDLLRLAQVAGALALRR